MLPSDLSLQTDVNQEPAFLPDWFIDLSVFTAGMATMVVEFGASRLLSNVFGTSNIVWAVIIGLVLVYLTLGNWWGGKLADKNPQQSLYIFILSLAGFTAGIIPLISRPILRLAANAFDQLSIPILAGSFVTVLLLFILPVTLLGMVTPFALKLRIRDTRTSGKVSGRLSAISTLGSFAGTFLAVLVLIPTVGTYRSFILVSLVLLLLCVAAFLRLKKPAYSGLALVLVLVLVLLSFWGLRSTDKNTAGLVFEDESAYNYIQVLQDGDFRFLRLNEGQGVHSIYHPTQLFYQGPWSQVLSAPFFVAGSLDEVDVREVAILGLAAGTSARQIQAVFPDAHVDGFELDPEIIQVGRQWFGMDLPNLTAYAEDARWGISHSARAYDIISIDAYRPPYIPAHMVTVEFFEIVYARLNQAGVMVINVGRSPADRSLVNALSSTILEVFPSVFAVDLPDSYNTILFAARSKTASWEHFAQNYATLTGAGANPLLLMAMQTSLAGKTEDFEPFMVFTDDKAPIEFLSNRMVLDFVLFGEIKE